MMSMRRTISRLDVYARVVNAMPHHQRNENRARNARTARICHCTTQHGGRRAWWRAVKEGGVVTTWLSLQKPLRRKWWSMLYGFSAWRRAGKL